MKSIVLPEQIVGSNHELPLLSPRILERVPATAIVSIKPATALVSRSNDLHRAAHDTAKLRAEAFSPVELNHTVAPNVEIPIRFWPKFPGDHEADVQVLLRWPDDDAMELRTIRVYGHARRLDQAPEHALGGTATPVREPSQKEIPAPDLSHVNDGLRTDLTNLFNRTKTAASSLARSQQSGMGYVKDEAMKYEQKPPKTTPWEHLCEVALTMAIGGIAGGVAKAVGAGLGGTKYGEGAIADAVKEGLKWAGKKAFLSSSNTVTGMEIAYFAKQFETLNDLATQNEMLVDREHERIQHVLAKDPERAIAQMRALRDGFMAMKDVAKPEQLAHTQRGWVSLVARAENGSEMVDVNGEQRQTTDLRLATGATRGVLRIRAYVDGELRVASASIDGIAQRTADRLLTQDLRKEPIPIVILATEGRNASFVTRDEVGRVRLSHAPEGEVQSHRATEQFVQKVLAKPLTAWGVTHIATDAKETRLG